MRKCTLLAVAIGCFCFASNAQISKGSVYLGGGIGYSKLTENRTTTPMQSQPSSESQQKAVVVSPAIGIALKQNLILGINFTYGKTTEENLNGGTTKREIKAIGAGLFLRRYYPLAKRFYAFSEINAGYTDLSTVQEYNSSSFFPNYKLDGWNISATIVPGVSYNVTKALYLELGFADLFEVGYTKQVETQTSSGSNPTVYTSTRKSFDIGTSLFNSSNLNIGVRFIIPKK